MLIRIGALSERTGVSAEVLRSWERRYRLLTPRRTTGGFRLYDDDDVARIRTMTRLLATGLSASEAAGQVLEPGQSTKGGAATQSETALQEVSAALHVALRSFDELALESALDLLLSQFDLDTAIRDLLLPALRRLGDDWEEGTVSVAQEHFSVNVLRGRLMGLARGWDRGFGPRALLACPSAEYHDTSLILFGLALRRRGWRITFLGSDTPFEELLGVHKSLTPRLIVLFAADWSFQSSLVTELSANEGLPLLLAGSSAGPIAAATGRRWLRGDPVTEAETLTQEFTPSPPGTRRPGVHGK
ncbi:MAG: MerR family transcriptional regulator [Tepidiformaceae bacterium]